MLSANGHDACSFAVTPAAQVRVEAFAGCATAAAVGLVFGGEPWMFTVLVPVLPQPVRQASAHYAEQHLPHREGHSPCFLVASTSVLTSSSSVLTSSSSVLVSSTS